MTGSAARIPLFLLVCLTSAAGAQSGVERRLAVAADPAVRITNLVGKIEIAGWDLDSVVVTGTVPPSAGRFFAAGSGRFVKLGVESQDPTLTGPGATLVVRVPRMARVWVKTASAPVTVTGLAGEIEVSSMTGSVTVIGAPRVATLESIDGPVEIRGAATLSRVKTGTGTVRLSGVRGEFTISTVQGGATVETEEILAGRIETVSGPVEVTGALAAEARLEVVTHDGDSGLHLRGAVDARFDLSAIGGRIVTRMFNQPEKVYTTRTALFWVGPSAGTERGAAVTVKTFKGSIRIDSNPK